MFISEEYYKITFSADTSKDALIKCTKWLAQNIIMQKVEAGEIHYKIKRIEQESFPTFELTLYSAINEKDINLKFCERCQEFNRSFLMNSEARCSSCHMRAYFEQLKQRFKIIIGYRKKILS